MTQKNQFAGVARNNGMDHATGKYIIFLDSDDFFELSMLEKMYTAAEENNADITICGFSEFDMKTEKIRYTYSFEEGCFSPKDFGKDCFTKFIPSPCRLYNREFIINENLRFQAIENTNDTYFDLVARVVAKRIKVIGSSLFYYRVNNKSSLQGSFAKKKLCFGDALSAIKTELEKRGLYECDIEESFCIECTNIMRYYFTKADSVIVEQNVYKYCLDLLSAFSFKKEFERYFNSSVNMSCLFKGESYIDYLFADRESIRCELNKKDLENKKEIAKIKSETISKKSTTYKIGHALLIIPDRIQRLIKG